MQEPTATAAQTAGRFLFERDTFAFPNELVWEYDFDDPDGPIIRQKTPPPTYSHHCFVLVRSARQFLYHASFEPSLRPVDENTYRRRIKEVVSRNPRVLATPEERIPFPGYHGLREFSRDHEHLLKACCGGAWQSYVLRSHWRMVFPISRRHQIRTADRVAEKIRAGIAPILHLVRFPQLTINHGVIAFAMAEMDGRPEFLCYDPNVPERPAMLRFDRQSASFSMPANAYWGGGPLDVIEIYHGWLY